MSTARRSVRHSPRLLVATGFAGLLVGVSSTLTAAQDLPPCQPGLPASECQLPTWPEGALGEVPSPFGQVQGTVWLDDVKGDAPPGGVDILAVGIGELDVTDAAVLRDADWLLKLGKAKQAVRPGRNVVVRIMLDQPLDAVAEGHASVHVATDRDRSRSNNAPVGVGEGEQPFAGSEDVSSVTYATTTAATSLLDSDLARAWYEDDDEFAAAWAAPTVLDILLRPEALGDGISVVTHTSGSEGGYDRLSLETGPIPLDGAVGLLPVCLEASISKDPYLVTRLVENGQTLRDVEAPGSWQGGAAFAPDAESLEALRAWISVRDDDGDGQVSLPAEVNLFEDGVVIGQRPELQLALAGEQVQLALELGITRRGYEVLRAIELDATGDATTVDAWLAAASDAFVEAMPPFLSGKKSGMLVGETLAGCTPALAGIWGESSIAGPDEGLSAVRHRQRPRDLDAGEPEPLSTSRSFHTSSDVGGAETPGDAAFDRDALPGGGTSRRPRWLRPGEFSEELGARWTPVVLSGHGGRAFAILAPPDTSPHRSLPAPGLRTGL